MKMRYSHRGKQFFFITLTLKGRPAALSRLVDIKSPPELLPPGEAVQAVLRSIHSVLPYITLSNNVIMPDHLHFLLIVNYDQAPDFNPMWFSFVLMETIETIWAAIERGQSPSPAAFLKEILTRSRNRASAYADCSSLSSDLPSYTIPPSPASLEFDRRAFIELSFNAQQLKAIRRYIRLNPARAIWKREHPDRFLCHPNIRHRVLDPARRWSGIGNLTLLGSPFLFPVRLTLRKPLADHEDTIAEFVERAASGEIPVSGFISPGERELLRRLKETPDARYIKVLPCTLPPRYDPSAEDSRDLAADRLLLLSGFPDTPAISTQEMRQNEDAAHQFRQNCLALNDQIAEICQKARQLNA